MGKAAQAKKQRRGTGGDDRLRVRSAARLGPQLHFDNRVLPAPYEPGRITPITMALKPGRKPRPGKPPHGGFWTASPNAHGSAGIIDWCCWKALEDPKNYFEVGGRLWRLELEPDATVLVVSTPDAFYTLRDRYPTARRGLDFVALFDAMDVDGIRFSDQVCRACRPDGATLGTISELNMGQWVHADDTLWARYVFRSCDEIPLTSASYPIAVEHDGRTHHMRYCPLFFMRLTPEHQERARGSLGEHAAKQAMLVSLLVTEWERAPAPLTEAGFATLPVSLLEAIVGTARGHVEQRIAGHHQMLAPWVGMPTAWW